MDKSDKVPIPSKKTMKPAKRTVAARRAIMLLASMSMCGTFVSNAFAAPGPNPNQSWSTNFASLSNLAEAGILAPISGTQLSIDTTNVNSGGKSIKTSGTIDDQHILQAYFTIHGLTGKDTADLSSKRLSVEVFVPYGSPLSYLQIELASRNSHMNVRANIFAQKGRWYTYQADLKLEIALASWQYQDWMHSPDLSSSADAIDFLKHVQDIKVNGQNAGSNETGDTSFLIDRIGWEPSGDIPANNPTVDSLRKYADARNLLLGSYVELDRTSDPQFMRILLQQFDNAETQEAIYWPIAEPVGDSFEASVRNPADTFMENVAGRLGFPPVRYLVFGNLPNWLAAKSYEETQSILENWVRAQVGYHKGKTKIWVIFNELLRYDIGWAPYTGLGLKDRNQQTQDWNANYMPFAKSPSDVSMIEAAFQEARAADPGARLFLDDGAVAEMGHPRADAFYDLVAKLVRDNTPIDGVGLQANLVISDDGDIKAKGDAWTATNFTDCFAGIAKNVERYQALGLKVAFIDVDVAIWTLDLDNTPAGKQKLSERLQLQAEAYRSLLHITLTHHMPAFVLFDWPDQWSWTINDPLEGNKYGDPGIYDADYQPKPAYYALLDELKGSK